MGPPGSLVIRGGSPGLGPPRAALPGSSSTRRTNPRDGDAPPLDQRGERRGTEIASYGSGGESLPQAYVPARRTASTPAPPAPNAEETQRADGTGTNCVGTTEANRPPDDPVGCR